MAAPARRPPGLLGVVENDAEGEARTAVDSADAMPEIDAVVAARAFYRAVARGEDNRLSLLRGDNFGFGLRAGLLFDEHEFSAFPVDS